MKYQGKDNLDQQLNQRADDNAIYYQLKLGTKNVPDSGFGLWVLHWFCLQVLSFWVAVTSEVYFCCNFLSISWKLAFLCPEQHHSTKLVANSLRAEGIVYFFLLWLCVIYLVIWKPTVWESQEPTLMWETKEKEMLLIHNEGLSSANQHLCIAKVVLPPQPYSCVRIVRRWTVYPIGNVSCPLSACSEWCPYAPKYLHRYSTSFSDSLAFGPNCQ